MNATTIFQAIAAGVLGKAAFAGGAGSAALGLLLHLAIMCVGVAYGLLTWAAMNYVIVPLSRASAPPFILSWFVYGLLAHLLLVGLLFAFVARRSALSSR